jgi:hypothetical protein
LFLRHSTSARVHYESKERSRFRALIRSCQTPASKKTKVGFEHQLAACCVPVARIRELGAGNRNVNVTRHKKSRHAAMDMDGGLQLKASQRHTGPGRSTPATTTLTMGTLEASKPKRKQHAHPRHALAEACPIRGGRPCGGVAAACAVLDLVQISRCQLGVARGRKPHQLPSH